MQIGFASSVVLFVLGMAASLKISLSLRWSWRQVGSRVPRRTMVARQCSRRGGDLLLNIREDGRLDVEGEAVVVFSGTITI